jgi:hypothetical protein
MQTNENSHWQYSKEEQLLAEHIIGLEKAALDRWLLIYQVAPLGFRKHELMN